MHALLVGRDTLLVLRTHFIPLLCVFYTLFTKPILLPFQTKTAKAFLTSFWALRAYLLLSTGESCKKRLKHTDLITLIFNKARISLILFNCTAFS